MLLLTLLKLLRLQYLATVEEHHGNTIDWKSLYEKALNHDFAEVFTGDIKTPVKYAKTELKMLFLKLNKIWWTRLLMKKYLNLIKIFIENDYKGKDDSLEGQFYP